MSLTLSFSLKKVGGAHKGDGMRNTFLGAMRFAFLLAFLLALTPVWAKEAAPVAADPEIEKRMTTLSEDLRCLVCQTKRSRLRARILRTIFGGKFGNKCRLRNRTRRLSIFSSARYGDSCFIVRRSNPQPYSYGLVLSFFFWAAPSHCSLSQAAPQADPGTAAIRSGTQTR